MNDIEQLKLLDLGELIKFLKKENATLKQEVKRLRELLNGEDIIKNSLGPHKKSWKKSSY